MPFRAGPRGLSIRLRPRGRGRFFSAAALAFWLCALLALAPVDASARAGGGEGYSSGGGSSSYSGGGSSSYGGSGGSGGGSIGGGHMPVWAWLGMLGPLVVLFGLLVLQGYRSHQQYLRDLEAERVRAGESSRRRAALLRQRDPDFDAGHFLSRVSAAFVRIQAAWSAQDLDAVRAWLSDSVIERFSVQLAEQRERRYRNRVEDVEVLVIELLEVESREHFDAVAVRIRAKAWDERVDLETGRRVEGTAPITGEFTEVWSLLRRSGSRSASGHGLLESCCPSCAAPLDPRRPDCASCGAGLVGAPRDWVLCEITQASEWQERAGAGALDAKRIRARDPGFSLEHLEDRASLLFWRWRDAVRRADVSKLVSVASPAFVAAERTRLLGSTRIIADCAVGSVRTLGIAAPEDDSGRSGALERAVVAVRWAGKRFHRDDPGRARGESRRESWLVMGRRAGSRSDIGRSLATARCGACGGPDAGECAACVWCGETLNDGSQDWVLQEIVAPDTHAARMLHAELSESRDAASVPVGSRVSAAGLVAWLVSMAASDGRIRPRERRTLHRVARLARVAPAQLTHWIQAALRGELECESPAPGEAPTWHAALEQLARADGSLHPREAALLAKLAEPGREG